MPTNRRKRFKQRTQPLTTGQKSELAHGYHFDGETGFDTEEAEKKSWFAHREEICRGFCPLYPGRMPVAWWKFETTGNPESERGFFGIRLNTYETEHQCLTRLGLLDKAKELGYCFPQIHKASAVDDFNSSPDSFMRGYP